MEYYCPICKYKMEAIYCECEQHDSLHTFREHDDTMKCGHCHKTIEPKLAKKLKEIFDKFHAEKELTIR